MPCDLNETDPFEKVYNALWTLVERNPYFVTPVLRPGNKIKFNKEQSYKINIAHADTPELQLLLGPMSNFDGNCSVRYVTKTYTWAMSTGSEIRTIHNKVSFELYRSLVDCEATLSVLTWCNCPFFKQLRIVTEDVGRALRDLNREVDGWASLLIIEVDFTFPYTSLKVL